MTVQPTPSVFSLANRGELFANGLTWGRWGCWFYGTVTGVLAVLDLASRLLVFGAHSLYGSSGQNKGIEVCAEGRVVFEHFGFNVLLFRPHICFELSPISA